VLQIDRWEQILQNRIAMGSAMNMSHDFMKKFLELLHEESINVQTEVS